MSSAEALSFAIGPVAMAVTYVAIRLTHALLDLADERFSHEALSHDPYGDDRVLGDWPRPASDLEIRNHAERNAA